VAEPIEVILVSAISVSGAAFGCDLNDSNALIGEKSCGGTQEEVDGLSNEKGILGWDVTPNDHAPALSNGFVGDEGTLRTDSVLC
jgi:hypothetical protein